MEGEARAVEASARPRANLRINFPLFFLKDEKPVLVTTDSAKAMQANIASKLLPKCRLYEESACFDCSFASKPRCVETNDHAIQHHLQRIRLEVQKSAADRQEY